MNPREPLLHWETLRAIIGGTSALDLPRIRVETDEEAHEFVCCYGYDWNIPEQREQGEQIRAGAIRFLEEEILGPEVAIDPEVRAETDVRRLVRWAGEGTPTPRQRWSCALLRVMHAVAHCNFPLQDRYGRHIRQQILARFHPHLFPRNESDGGALRLGSGEDSVPLIAFDVKEAKPLASTVMKLLHKVENVATDIFDHIGVRFVTRDRLDALLVVRYLRAHNVFMFANVKPTRSRNTLLDLDAFEASAERALRSDPDVDRGALLEDLRATVGPPKVTPQQTPRVNAFSATNYQSLQFTSRQLIRVPDDSPSGEEIRFFFPYEVQVLDEASFRESRSGRASHEEYRSRQREAVRRRVLGSLVP
jgi:uncharacterized protein (TIGR04562 family)